MNQTTYAVHVVVNDASIDVAAGATTAPMYFVPDDADRDTLQSRADNLPCGMASNGGYNLSAPHRYRMVITDVEACYVGKTIVGAPTPLGQAFTQIS